MLIHLNKDMVHHNENELSPYSQHLNSVPETPKKSVKLRKASFILKFPLHICTLLSYNFRMEEICPLNVRKQLTFMSDVKAPKSSSPINLHEELNKYKLNYNKEKMKSLHKRLATKKLSPTPLSEKRHRDSSVGSNSGSSIL